MDPDLARALVREAQQGAPNEVCGFVLQDWMYLPINNISATAQRNFSMDPDEMLNVLMHESENVIGVYHSHPGGTKEPSETDIAGWQYPMFRYWIVTYQDVYEWRIEDDCAKPVRRDGTTGLRGMAYPVLAPAEALRREGGRPAA